MTRECTRCGQRYVVVEPQQTRCFQCAGEVARIIEADEKRRTRFPHAKDMTGRAA